MTSIGCNNAELQQQRQQPDKMSVETLVSNMLNSTQRIPEVDIYGRGPSLVTSTLCYPLLPTIHSSATFTISSRLPTPACEKECANICITYHSKDDFHHGDTAAVDSLAHSAAPCQTAFPTEENVSCGDITSQSTVSSASSLLCGSDGDRYLNAEARPDHLENYDDGDHQSPPLSPTHPEDDRLTTVCDTNNKKSRNTNALVSLPLLPSTEFSIDTPCSPLVILLAGASGCGKSTLASILAFRYSIRTIVSTDHIRSSLRYFFTKEQFPILFASTYEAWSCTKRRLQDSPQCDTLSPGIESRDLCCIKASSVYSKCNSPNEECVPGSSEALDMASSTPCACVEGYLQQSAILAQQILKIISFSVSNNESIVVEGVHLTISLILRLQSLYPSICLPFIVYVDSQDTHLSRFAARGTDYSVEPEANKYVRHMQSIRCIQSYFCRQAKELEMSDLKICTIENTQIDRAIHKIFDTVGTLQGRP